MISPHTPPGTEVLCINAGPPRSAECPTRLIFGQVYRVKGWTTELMSEKPLVDLVENYHEDWAWEPECFRPLELAGLDALLDARVKEKA